MKQTLRLIGLAAVVTTLMNSCTKEPGFGGNSAITGSAQVRIYNASFSELIEEIDLADEYVYLTAAGRSGYLERIRTSYNGTFEFNNLNPGDYVVYAYSKDTTGSSLNDIAVQLPVSITKAAESVNAGTLVVADTRATGNSTIGGRVMKQSQSNPNLQYPAQDDRVFIIYNDDLAYTTYTRTTFDGYYLFDRLPVGKYRIYAYSLDIDNVSLNATIPVLDSLTITQDGTHATMPDLVIY